MKQHLIASALTGLVLALAAGPPAAAENPSTAELRRKAVHIAYRLDAELGEVDGAQRHLQVARLLLGLETAEFTPAAALDELWIDWETTLESRESLLGTRGLPAWFEPAVPDLVDALILSILPDPEPLIWSDALWVRGEAAMATRALTQAAAGTLAAPHYAGALAWARSRAPDIWFRLLTTMAETPELTALLTPLVDPWLALPLSASLADWENLDDRSSEVLDRLLATGSFDPLALIDAEIDLLFDTALLIDRHRRPTLIDATYQRFLHATDDRELRALVALARGIHRIDRGDYAGFVGALYGLVFEVTRATGDGAYSERLLSRLDRLDRLLLPFLNRVDPRLINVYQRLRRLLREPPDGPEAVQHRMRELAALESALGLDTTDLERYLAQPFRRRLGNELIICTQLGRADERPPEPITREQFDGCVAVLGDWATGQATTPELSGQPEGPFALEILAREAQLSPWQRINYWLAYITSELAGDCSVPQAPLVNPIEWAIASRVMIWFMDRWSQLIDAAAITRLRSVGQAGVATLEELARTRRCMTADRPLLGALGVYAQQLDSLQESLRIASRDFRTENLRPGADIDLAGSAEQPTQYRPADLSVAPCDDRPWCDVAQVMEASKALYSLFPDPYLIADQARLGRVRICYRDVAWVDRRAEVLPVGNEVMATYHGRLSFVLEGRYSGLEEPVFAMRLVSPDEYEYLFGENAEAVLSDPCPRHLVDTQVHAEMAPARIELVPRRLTFMTADRTHPGRVLSANWRGGQEWRDWFVTGRGTEVLSRQDESPIRDDVASQLRRLNTAWNETLYRQMLAAGSMPDGRQASPLTTAMQAMQTAKLVAAAVAKLLVPRSLESDPALRASLFGEPGLLDRGAILRLQQSGVPIDEVGAVARRRLIRAEQLWEDASTEIARQPLAETEPLLAAGLLKLAAAEQRMTALAGGAPGPSQDQ